MVLYGGKPALKLNVWFQSLTFTIWVHLCDQGQLFSSELQFPNCWSQPSMVLLFAEAMELVPGEHLGPAHNAVLTVLTTGMPFSWVRHMGGS